MCCLNKEPCTIKRMLKPKIVVPQKQKFKWYISVKSNTEYLFKENEEEIKYICAARAKPLYRKKLIYIKKDFKYGSNKKL